MSAPNVGRNLLRRAPHGQRQAEGLGLSYLQRLLMEMGVTRLSKTCSKDHLFLVAKIS